MEPTYWLIPLAILVALGATLASGYVSCRVWERLHAAGSGSRRRMWDLLGTYAVTVFLIAIAIATTEVLLR